MCRVQIEHWQISKLCEWTATKNEMCSPHTHAILLLCALFNYLCAPSNLTHHRLTTFDRFNQHTTHRKSMVFKSSGVIFAIVRDAQKHHKKTIERKETREKDTQNEKKTPR